MKKEKKTKNLNIAIEPYIFDSLRALAARDSETTVSAIVRRAILKELGLSKDAVDLWEAEGKVSEVVDERLEALGLLNDIQRLREAQDKIVEKIRESGRIDFPEFDG